MKFVKKYLPLLLIWLVVILMSGNHVLIKQRRVYNEYNGMKGIVTWVTFAPQSSIYLCGVRLSNGVYGDVNWGSCPVKVGDSFLNRIYYNSMFGISGTAYCVLPEMNEALQLLYIFTVVLPIITGLVWLIGFLIRLWIDNS